MKANPKKAGTKSRKRYELYKVANTLRDMKRCGASWDDVKNDFAQGYIKFDTDTTATVLAPIYRIRWEC